jgi:16S rRNA processing protein RimM
VSSRSSSNSDLSFPGFYRVGYVQSAHGIRGELSLRLFAAQADWLGDAEELSLLARGSERLNHFNIIKVRPHKEGLIALLAGISSRNDAEALKGATVFIREELLTADEGEQIYLRQIEGFELVDAENVVLGRIVGFSSNGSQDLLLVERAGGGATAMVPFVDDFLIDIDHETRRVRMNLPPGLLDIE